MLNIIRMDWLTMRWRGAAGPALFFFMTVMADWKETLSSDITVSILIVILSWYVEEKNNGRSLACSLPISRKTFIRGRFLSAWLYIGHTQLTLLAVILVKYSIHPDNLRPIFDIFQVRNVMLFLTVMTVIMLVITSLYARFNSKVIMYVFLIGAIIIIAPLISVSIVNEQFNGVFDVNPVYKQLGTVCKDTIQTFLRYDDPTVLNYVIAGTLLLIANFGTMWFAEKLFRKNNIHP